MESGFLSPCLWLGWCSYGSLNLIKSNICTIWSLIDWNGYCGCLDRRIDWLFPALIIALLPGKRSCCRPAVSIWMWLPKSIWCKCQEAILLWRGVYIFILLMVAARWLLQISMLEVQLLLDRSIEKSELERKATDLRYLWQWYSRYLPHFAIE